MSRAAVATLALVAVLLVSSGRREGVPEAEVRGDAAAVDADIRARIASYLGGQNPLLTERELARIADSVMGCQERHALDPYLVAGVMHTESTARPWAVSPKGAVGLMQVMPYMYDLFDLAGNITTIESNVEAGCVILADNIRRLGEADGILAYFWGARIRGVSYLHRVEEARAALREPLESRS